MKRICAGILLAAAFMFSNSIFTYGAYTSIGSEIKITDGAAVISDQTAAGAGLQTGEPEKSASDGNKVEVNNVEVSFVNGPGSRDGLPKEVTESVTAINSGRVPLYEAVKDVDLTGYNPLVKTSTIVMRDAVTQTEKKADVLLSFYVPNLMEGFSDVQVLFYDNETGKWMLLTPAKIDYAARKLSVKVTGSGTFTIIYKK